MTREADLRETLLRVDKLRKTARDAEMMRTHIRLFQRPRLRTVIVMFLERSYPLSEGETRALYGALAIVRDDAEREARDLSRSLDQAGDPR